MTRRISLLFVLALFLLAIASVTAFAAKAEKATGNGVDSRDMVPIPVNTPIAGSEEVSYDASIGKGSHTSQQSLGFNPDGTVTVGTSYLDYQHNGSMGRQIVVGGGWVHNLWMKLPTASTANRTIDYYAYQLGGAGLSNTPDIEGATGGGYTNVGYDAVGNRAVAAFHNVAAGGTRSGRDFALGAGNFTLFSFPAANCQGIISQGGTEGDYIWPTLAVDNDGANAIAHLVSSESTPAAGDMQTIVYYKSNNGITASGPTCGFFIDSVQTISPVIAQDPNSNKVAIAYAKPREYGVQVNSDMAYVESTDLGVTWGPIVNVSNYATGDLERAYTDCDAIYTSDGCLHIAWNAPVYDSVAGTISSQAAKLRHWDNCAQCMSLAFDANNFDPQSTASSPQGVWNRNVAKMNLSECTVGPNKLLYLTYTYFKSDSTLHDNSAAGWKNGDIYGQVSSTDGVTWGPPTNITNTTTDNCATGACKSEHWSSSAMYVTDSLRIQFVEDLDAGGIVQTEGNWTDNPIKNISLGCFTMTTFVNLGATPAEFSYPYNTAPGQVKNEVVTLSNSGNTSASWSVASTQPSWLGFSGPTSGSCPAGCTNTSTFTIRVTGPVTQGFYVGAVNVTYTSPDKGAQAVTSIPFELHNFTNFYLPQNSALRTAANRLNVNQASQLANNTPGSMFSYFDNPNPPIDYLYEGHLILGNDALNLSYSVFGGVGAPTASNPYGYTYAASPGMVIDSTSSASFRKATGKGVNRDTTLGFDVTWYASKHPDSADFYVGDFKVYKGSKNPTGTVSNLRVAFYTDWDVPADTGSDNDAGSDAGRSMVWQRGSITAPNDLRYGATAAYRNDGTDIIGGWVLDNPTYIYPDNGYDNDSLWNITSLLTQGQYRLYTGVEEDLSGGVLIYRGASVNGSANDTLKFAVVIAGTRNGGISGLNSAVDKAQNWICEHGIAPGADICSACACGDADNTGIITISDAVYLINYIFAGGPAPVQLCLGDADGTGIITISDAVFLINYIFAGGPAPSGC
ncbi:MAG: dockerin type I repeat-containing protein [Candidatus Zixiibacteriota bacterium]